jgi:hypothetical protein
MQSRGGALTATLPRHREKTKLIKERGKTKTRRLQESLWLVGECYEQTGFAYREKEMLPEKYSTPIQIQPQTLLETQ